MLVVDGGRILDASRIVVLLSVDSVVLARLKVDERNGLVFCCIVL